MPIEDVTIPNLFKKPGEHCIVGGITGSGKTQILYYILENLIKHNPREAIIWFDTGKSSELLRLSEFRPLKIFIPQDENCHREVSIEGDIDYEVCPFWEAFEIFQSLNPKKINVISLEPFYQEDLSDYTSALNEFFKELFRLAMQENLYVPLAIFIDEVHSVAPSHGMAFNEDHTKAAIRFQRNVERLRSAKVRVVGTIQDWTKLRRGVRTSFQWIVIKRGMTFTKLDLPQLAAYNKKWWTLRQDASIWVFPDRSFYNKYVKTPFYGDGRKLGKVKYLEEITKTPPPQQNDPSTSERIRPPSSMQELASQG